MPSQKVTGLPTCDVEIGVEQPVIAKRFWGNNGFAPVTPKVHAGGNPNDLLAGQVVEMEDWQLGFIDRRCLRYKDNEQLAKRVLVD